MKEEYLNYLWKTKNIPLQNLILTDGRPITISSFGFHNKDSGPDFSNGSIIIDGITWVGNIEIHINASDWYAHNHHSDKAYNNVILHVVYNNDKPVYINNEIIPTLELKALIPKNHLDNYSKMISNSKWIPCFDTFNHVDSIHIKNQIDVAVFQRLERKIKSISDRIWILNFDVNQLIIELVAGVLGTNVNRLPMLELVQRIPTNVFLKESKSNVCALLFEVANLFPDNVENLFVKELKINGRFYRTKYQLDQMNNVTWKFFGTYAAGFPTYRIAQLAELISNPFFYDFINSPMEEWINWFYKENFVMNDYWKNHYHFELETKKHKSCISNQTKELILINVVIPVLYWWGIHQQNERLVENAFILLENIQPESNSIIKNWKKLGITLISAKDSQGLLELKNEFCNRKKCLSCKIGHQLLKQ